MEELIILGLDIHNLEVIDIINMGGKYKFIGLISDKDDHPDEHLGLPVLGGPAKLAQYPDVKRVPMHVWKDRNDKTGWVNVIAPSAFVASTAIIGRGCIIYPNCFIGANACLKDGIFMLSRSVINHDNIIENDVTVTSGVTLAGSVTVKEGAYLGQACTVKQYLTIGTKSTVGMGAVVTRNVPDNTTVIGCPARETERSPSA